MSVPETPAPETTGDRPLPTSQPLLRRAVRWGLIAGAGVLVVMGGIGFLVSGQPGLVGALLGSAFGVIFLGMTAGSILIANRYVASDFFVVLFFSVVLGSWILKFVLFIIAALLLRDQPWLDPTMLFLGVIAAVIVSLVIDMIVLVKTRLPYVSDVTLP